MINSTTSQPPRSPAATQPPASAGPGSHRTWLRLAQPRDLDAINAMIARAIECWDLAERVKRVSLPVYAYDRADLDFLQLFVAIDGRNRIIGVAALEPADRGDCAGGHQGLLLHGIYVEPGRHRDGVGTRLLEAVFRAARGAGYDGVLARAQPGATAFFEANGFEPLRIDDPLRDYSHRYWYRLDGAEAG